MPFDPRSEKNIATLTPKAQARARRFLQAVLDAGISAKIISGTRSFAEQDALFAKGRTKPGPKVTNARGGFSNHNFGIAWDIGLFDGNVYIPESPDYARAGQIGKAQGLEWGGDWTTIRDEPHFQCPVPKTIAELRAIVLAHGRDIGPAAKTAIDALLPPPEPPPPPPPPATPHPTVEVYFGTRRFAIDAFLIESRTWVSARDFCDYFGGAVVDEAPESVTVNFHGDERALAAQPIGGKAFVAFSAINALLQYQFRFDSRTRRLTLSR